MCTSAACGGIRLTRADNDPACKPWTSTKWCPPGYAHRNDAAASENKAADQATLVEHASHDEHGEPKHSQKDAKNVV